MDDDTLDLIEEFARLFDPEAQANDDEQRAALLADLASALADPATGVEVAEELLGVLGQLVDLRRPTITDCAAELTRLAPRAARRPGALLAVGVDYLLGALAALEERWAEAGERIARVRPRIGPALLPEAVPDADQILGEVAFRRGDPATAQRCWTAARLGFLAAGRPEDAATATGGLAEIAERAGNVDGRAERLWAETAELFADTGDPAAARHHAALSCRLVLRELRVLPDAADTSASFARARAARDLAVRHDAPRAAVELLTISAVHGADQGLPWAEIAQWFRQARDECRALAGRVPAPEIETFLADIGHAEGSAAVNRNLPVEAEAALRPALAVYRAHGLTARVDAVTRLLTGVRAWLDGHRDLPDAARAAPDAHRALAMAALEAGAALQRGDPAPARRCIQRIDRHLAAEGPTSYRGAVQNLGMLADLLRAGLAQFDGVRGGAVATLARTESQLMARGAGLLAARVAVQRGVLLLAAGDPAAAVRVLVPAVLALDAVRFSLDGADRRRRWSGAVAEGFDAAYRAAAAVRDTRLLAELLEVARANAVPSPVGAGAGPTLDALLADDLPAHPQPTTTALPGAAALGNPHARTLLGVPAWLRTPWGGAALHDELTAARRYHDPVRADRTVDWLPT